MIFNAFQFVVPVISDPPFCCCPADLVNAFRHGGGHKFLRIVDAHLPVFIQLLYKHPPTFSPAASWAKPVVYRRFFPSCIQKGNFFSCNLYTTKLALLPALFSSSFLTDYCTILTWRFSSHFPPFSRSEQQLLISQIPVDYSAVHGIDGQTAFIRASE